MAPWALVGAYQPKVLLSSNAYVVTNFIRSYFSVYERFAKVQIITVEGGRLTQVYIKYNK